MSHEETQGPGELRAPVFRIEDDATLAAISARIGERLGAATTAAGFHIASAMLMNRDISTLVQHDLLVEVRPRGIALTADIVRQCEAIEMGLCKAAVNLGFTKGEFEEMCEQLFRVILLRAMPGADEGGRSN